jgi:cyanophycinase-like exopeptidase
MIEPTPGLIVLIGSGETLASSRKTHEAVAQRLPENPRIAILETPAGFEPNSDLVAGKIKEFLVRRLQNYKPTVDVLPARKKGTPQSPDNPDVINPLYQADEILLGPGSPTYAVRQLRDSLALAALTARHRLGATLFLASSATLAFSAQTMPVYEIYKVGQDLHWQPGLDFLGPYDLPLVIIPHWNNSDGGDELDTSRCYMGQARFDRLRALLPPGHTIIGLDEHTSLLIDFANSCCHVMGLGGVTVIRDGRTRVFAADERLPLEQLGAWRLPAAEAGIPPEVWERAIAAQAQKQAETAPQPGEAAQALLLERAAAREAKDWSRADRLRDELAALGWQVMDTPEGSELVPITE